ncbi:MAG: ABC transporter permease [Deltaproteobacteria bacterium]|nr:ABC transporter permease [Deltaproteobacteria bacterium]
MIALRRLATGLVILLGVSVLTFTLAFVVPSDPARTVAGPKADKETLDLIRREMGLDQPLPVQLGRYLGRLLRGDFGRSYVTRQDVRAAILERLPATISLAVSSLVLAIVLGLAAGVFTALRAGATIDLTVMGVSLVILSFPVFWLGLLLLDVVAYRLRWLPLGGYGGLRSVILPACALGLGHAAYYGRVLHAGMREVLSQDYIRTARAKGLGPLATYAHHALRNALIPLTTLVGLDFAGLMGGVVLTETVFNWPGLGRLAVDAVFNQDIPLIMGTVQFGAVLVVAVNLALDLVYRLIDPRIRYHAP